MWKGTAWHSVIWVTGHWRVHWGDEAVRQVETTAPGLLVLGWDHKNDFGQ